MTIKKGNSSKVYHFKVSLPVEHGEEEVWRIVALYPHQTLTHLHEVIFRAFDRYDEHLWSFFTGKPYKPGTVEYVGEKREPILFEEDNTIWAKRIRLSEFEWSKRKKYHYLFDYGDMWWHEIKFLGEKDAEPGKKYPATLEKHGDSPPQYLYFDDEDYDDDEDWDDEDWDDEDWDDEDWDDEDEIDFYYVPEEMIDLVETFDLSQEPSFDDLDRLLYSFEFGRDASEAVGVLRGLAASQVEFVPLAHYLFLLGLQTEVKQSITDKEMMESLRILNSLLQKFADELKKESFTKFCRQYDEKSNESVFLKYEDMYFELEGFLGALKENDLAEFTAEFPIHYKKMDEIKYSLEQTLSLRRKILKKQKSAIVDRLLEKLDEFDQQIFDFICSLSLYLKQSRSEFSDMNAPGDESPSIFLNAGRNDPCPCGSGKKFKKCCMNKEK